MSNARLQIEKLAHRAKVVKKRLLLRGATAMTVKITYDGTAPGEPHEPGVGVEITLGPFLAVAALEALCDDLDRREAEGDINEIPQDGMVDA